MSKAILTAPTCLGDVVERSSLLSQLDHLPNQWQKALVPIGRDKVPRYADGSGIREWQSHPPFTREELRDAPAIGLRLGRISCGTFTLDFDATAEDPSRVDSLFEETFKRSHHDLPKTLAWTSSKPNRRQLAFRVPESYWQRLDSRQTVISAPDGTKLEIRWEGQQSVVLGHHPETDGYSWLEGCSPSDLELAVAPEWLLDAIPLKKTRTKALSGSSRSDVAPAFDGLVVPLREFICNEHRLLVDRGSEPGSNNDQGLAVSLDLVGTEQWLADHGASPDHTAESLFELYLNNSENLWEQRAGECVNQGVPGLGPFNRDKAWQRFQGAKDREPSPSTPVETLKKRLEFHRRNARRQGRLNVDKSSSRARRLQPGELIDAILGELGQPSLNARTEQVHIGDQILTLDEVNSLYIQLSSPDTTWPKESTFDAVMLLARQNAFDPARQWLEAETEAQPVLSDEEWNRLDKLLLGIEDPVAAAYLPRFLVAAVARLFQPGCEVHQMPVLVGRQGIGKTRLGRALFGEDNYRSLHFSAHLGKDDKTQADMHWCNEFGEIDGLTSKADMEVFKDFLSTPHDVLRKVWGKGPINLPRRWVGWATSNGCPLRDLTGNRRFVCITLGEKPLPVEYVKSRRGSIWAKALQAYLQGFEWWSSPEEIIDIESRNLDHLEMDPWSEPILNWVQGQEYVQIGGVLNGPLELPKAQQNNAASSRVRRLLEAAGWVRDRRRPYGGTKKIQAMWAPGS